MVSIQHDALLIRHRKEGLDRTYVVVDALTTQVVAGPFATLAAAVEAAGTLVGPGGSLWQETADLRARPLNAETRRPLSPRE